MRLDQGRDRRAFRGLVLTLALALASGVGAQGTQTGIVTGTVSSTDGAGLPGVTVTLTSPAQQGARSAVTDATGSYIFRGLAPGQYTASFSLSGFATLERKVSVAMADARDVSPTLALSSVQESIEVMAEAPSILGTTQVGANYRAEAIDKLATPRTLAGIAELAPGLTDNTPNVGQVTIAGAFAYDNVFLLNGVDINDNLFGTANNLFIEDAIEEVQVLTSGVSAEFGRFSGGVINAVTKRGGDKLSGSFRTDFSNSAWQDESAFEKEQITAGRGQAHASKTNRIYQATLGGPIVKQRLWFFLAGRREMSADAKSLSNSGIPYSLEVENPRIEGKLTGSISANHNVSAAFISNKTKQNNRASINETMSIDPLTLVNRELPNNLFVANYNGVLTSNLFVEGQFSRKKQGFRGTGGTSTDILDSPFLALGRAGIPASRHFNGPYFDANDPEDRNNRQYSAALSYFLSTGKAGRHDLKVGGEQYTSSRTGGNSQSSTGYVFLADPKVVGGVPVQDANGRFIPSFVPGATQVQNWLPVRGAQINLHTLSVYVNDRWQLTNRWSFNLGARFERHTADTTQAGIVTPESTAFLPRLAATFDVKGDGKWILQATYGHYAGKASETQFADNTNVGSPNRVTSQYNGPAGEGLGFAPGFNLGNYSVVSGSFPVENVFLDDSLKTPTTKEWTLQAGTRLGSRGEVKAIYTHRRTTNFLDDFITLDKGRTTVTRDGRVFGTFDNAFITNTDLPERAYQGAQLQAFYRITDHWSVQGHYTLQFKNDGNFEGEAANQPGNYSIIGNQPEFYSAERNYPTGRLDDFQRHKALLFSTYDLSLGRAGRATLGVGYRYDSPTTYSLLSNNVPLTAIQRAKNPGYANVPTTQTLFYADRGSEFFEAAHLLGLALTYDLPNFKTVQPYVKVDLRNALNSQPLITADFTTTPNNAGPVDALGLPLEFVKGANFGKGTSNIHYPVPREFRISVGVRF